jgi:hypothetical protein
MTTQSHINHLISTYSEGGFEAAKITEKGNTQHYYQTELEDIGPVYLMDDFGTGIVVSWEMLMQRMEIFPPLHVLT